MVRLSAAVLALTSIVLAGLAGVAPSYAEEGDPVITWPEITALNPTTTPYEVTTAYDGPGYLFLRVHENRGGALAFQQDLPANGTVAVAFTSDHDGTFYLQGVLCPAAGYDPYACSNVGEPRILSVYDEVVAKIQERDLRGPSMPFSVEAAPVGEAGFDVEWEVVPAEQPDSAPLVSGQAAAAASWRFDLALPQIGESGALVHGQRYRLEATLRTETTNFGSIEGSVAAEFEWDSVNSVRAVRIDVFDDVVNERIRNADVIYPATTRTRPWRASAYVVVLKDAPEVMKRTTVTVTDLSGEVVAVRTISAAGGGYWNGYVDNGGLAPEGWYSLSTEVVDRQGNVETYSSEVRVSHERLVQRTREIAVSPRRSMIKKFVGRCASVQSPARSSWRGSIRLRSETSGSGCRSAGAPFVQTVHGAYLPESPFRRHDLYDLIRVSTYGGASPRARKSHLVHLYWTRGDEWGGYKKLGGEIGWHAGYETGPSVVQWDEEYQRYYVVWTVWLTNGMSYDVKDFKLRVRHWALVPPR